MDDHFYVTLPSSTALESNTVTNFTTHLHTPLDFDNHEYEVALSEIHLRAKLSISFNQKTEDQDTFITFKSRVSKDKYNELGTTPISVIISYPLSENVNVELITEADCILEYVHFKINNEFFNDIEALFSYINKVLTNAGFDYVLEHKMNENTIIIKSNSIKSFEVMLSNLFLSMLEKKEQYMDVLKCDGELALKTKTEFYDVHELSELFIYTNIVEHNHVGNTISQLLRVITLTDSKNNIVKSTNTFVEPHYLKVNSHKVCSITIELRDIMGYFFPIKLGHCIVKLHFRKI